MSPFNPFPVLHTPRLILRALTEADAPEILHLRSDPTINRYIKRPPERQTRTLEDALKTIRKVNGGMERGENITWGITRSDHPAVMGTILLWNLERAPGVAELGYDLDTVHHGQGIMSEALTVVLDFGWQQLQLQMIEAYTQHNNAASRRMLEKYGFVVADTRSDPGNPDNLIYELRR